MLGGLTVRVDGVAFARACNNALAQLPARGNRFPYGRLRLARDGATVTATDGYTLGRAACPYDVAAPQDLGEGISVCVPRDGLAELDRLGRAAKGPVEITVRPEAVELVSLGAGEAAGLVMCEPVTWTMAELWEASDAILDAWPTGRPAVPELIALDPQLWARFAKVKVASGKAAMCDLLITGPDEPVLIRVGPDFLGAIMPVDRQVASAAAARGADFLW